MDIWDRFGISASMSIAFGGAGLLLLSLWALAPGKLAASLAPLPENMILGGMVIAVLWSLRRGPHYVRLLARKTTQEPT